MVSRSTIWAIDHFKTVKYCFSMSLFREATTWYIFYNFAN